MRDELVAQMYSYNCLYMGRRSPNSPPMQVEYSKEFVNATTVEITQSSKSEVSNTNRGFGSQNMDSQWLSSEGIIVEGKIKK